MAVILSSTGVTFPAGSIQTAAAVVPTNISSFTNDSGYVTAASGSYSWSYNMGSGMNYDLNASISKVGTTATFVASANCNCACNC
jgi:hypothetical protein